jgi:hypothetical protein
VDVVGGLAPVAGDAADVEERAQQGAVEVAQVEGLLIGVGRGVVDVEPLVVGGGGVWGSEAIADQDNFLDAPRTRMIMVEELAVV